MTITYRAPGPEEIDAVIAAGELPFGDRVQPDDAAYFKELIEPDRVVVAEEAGRIVGVGAGQSLELSTPGGTIPLCAVGLVSVLPTHRRRGIARTLLDRLHRQAAEHGEPAAGLVASEASIYSTFGYGIATRWATREIATAHARLREPVDTRGRLRFVEPDEGADLLLDCLKSLSASTPGIPLAADARVRGRLTRDPAHWRDGGARMLVAYEDRGVVAYHVKQDWSLTGPAHALAVTDLVARDDTALAGLWAYVLTVDLVAQVRAIGRPVDEPLPHLLRDPRRLRTTVTDGLWLRPLDAPALLGARDYDRDGEWTLAIVDSSGPAGGTYRLVVREGRASVEPGRGEPDLTLPVDTFGAAYLGDARLTTLARAGRAVEHSPGSLRALERALAWDRLPWCPFEL